MIDIQPHFVAMQILMKVGISFQFVHWDFRKQIENDRDFLTRECLTDVVLTRENPQTSGDNRRPGASDPTDLQLGIQEGQ